MRKIVLISFFISILSVSGFISSFFVYPDRMQNIIVENLNLKRQIDDLKAELENSNKDDEAHLNFENLSAELNNLRAEREEEKKELQSLYDQLSSALAASGETV